MVDPGGDVDVILQTVRENGITLKAIWLTHGHIDHAGGADELRETLGLEVVGPHEDDRPLLQDIEAKGKMFNIEGVRNVVPDPLLERR